MDCIGCTRRAALSAIVVLATGPALAKCTEKGVDVGAAKAWSIGTFKLIEAEFGRVIVARDGKGLYAFSGMCTHMGGAVYLSDDKGTNGEVIRGPAIKPLPHFAVKVCDGRVLVDPVTVVDADARTPL